MIDHPDLSPWMLHDGDSVRATAERLREIARTVGGVEITVRDTLGSAATNLGWRGQITDRATETSETTRTMLTRVADACEAAGTALLELSATMAWHGPRLLQLVLDGGSNPTPRFGLPVEPRIGLPVEPHYPEGMRHTLPVERDSVFTPGDLRHTLPVEPPLDGMRHTLPIDRDPFPGDVGGSDREQQIRQHIDDLTLADQRCHDQLSAARDDLIGLSPDGTDPHFLRSLLPHDAWLRLLRAGLVPLRPKEREFEHNPGFPVGGRGNVTTPVPPGMRTTPGEHVTPGGRTGGDFREGAPDDGAPGTPPGHEFHPVDPRPGEERTLPVVDVETTPGERVDTERPPTLVAPDPKGHETTLPVFDEI